VIVGRESISVQILTEDVHAREAIDAIDAGEVRHLGKLVDPDDEEALPQFIEARAVSSRPIRGRVLRGTTLLGAGTGTRDAAMRGHDALPFSVSGLETAVNSRS